MIETKLYGVSTGDGNNGVSHMFPDYYVRTDDPWLLARAAAYGCWKPQCWPQLSDALQVDGESEFIISAWLYAGDEPGAETPVSYRECEDCQGSGERDQGLWCFACDGTGRIEEEDEDAFCDMPAPFILEVFPVASQPCECCGGEGVNPEDDSPCAGEKCTNCNGSGQVPDTRYGRPVYDSLEAALSADVIELARKDG